MQRVRDTKPVDDPFKTYLTGNPPEILKNLGEETEGDIKIRRLIFHSRDVNVNGATRPSIIYAVVTRPVRAGKYPGLLLLHGGGGSAEIDKAKKWAALGYVVVTLDIPGICPPEKVPFSEGHWKSHPYGSNRFTAQPDITASTIFDGVLAVAQAFYLLRDQPDVIKSRIGITGISWGGYMTTMVSGMMGSKVQASFSVFGSGFYDEASVFLNELNKMPPTDRETWLRYLDGGRRIAGHKSAFFIAGAANDNWFYPPAVTATLTAMKGPVNHLFAANANHKIPDPGGTTENAALQPGWLSMETVFFDHYLRDVGSRLPAIVSSNQLDHPESGSAGVVVQFRVKSETPVQLPRIYYSVADKEWTKREWRELPAFLKNKNTYQAELPADIAGKEIDWYPSISDTRPVTVSGYIRRIKK